ncbi:MAG: hypothetical protein WC389_22685 [Lutibacter sp.]|jgi:hypothetical protein
MKTGILIRAEVNGKMGNYDIGDEALTDKQLLDWMLSRSESKCAERVVLLLLGRDQTICD